MPEYELCVLNIVNIIRNGSLLDFIHCLINDEKRNAEPLARNDQMTETVLDLDS